MNDSLSVATDGVVFDGETGEVIAGLDALAVAANDLHARAADCAESAVDYAQQCGAKLIEAKAQLRHGEWLPWLEANFAGSRQKAQAYMKLSKGQRVGFLPPDERPKSIRQGLRLLAKEEGAHVQHNSGENEWYTPPEYIEAARRAMGGIDLDPATSDTAQETVRAGTYYTAKDDGLKQAWQGRVWMNPPYAQPLVTEFCDKVAIDYQAGAVSAACVLINNATETSFGQRLLRAASAVCFPEGRIRFLDPDGEPGGAPLQGQMIVYLGPDPNGFGGEFSVFGVVVYGR